LSVGRLGNVGLGKRTIGWCMLFLGMVAGGAAAENATATQTTLTVATDNAGPRTRATLTAHVSGDLGVPSGVVNFRSGQTDLGSALVDSGGKASLETDLLPAGSHPVVAIYQGQSAYLNSTSNAELVQANVSTAAGFTVAATPTSLSTAVGGFVSSIVTVTPVNGFNAYVSLSCTGLPINATCTFAPINVQAACTTGAGGAQTCTPGTSVIQIQTQTPSPTAAARNSDVGMRRYAFVFPVLFGLAGMGARKRRAWRNLTLGMVAFAGVMAMTACNARYNYLNHGPPANPGTPIGSYTITVQASSSTGSETTTPPTQPQITLVVTAAKT
jgi:Bacterial Ig-like domain (group 3)